MTARFELVIFDCDGVLVDSERLAVRVDVEFLARLGWIMSEAEVVERFVGRSDADMRRAIEEHLGGSIPPDIDDEFERAYRETLERELVAVDGVEAVLRELSESGAAMCVASSGTHAKIGRSLRQTGLLGYFGDRIFSATDVARGKPAPDLFLHAAASLGAQPNRCAVVEDSGFGVQAAAAAGMHVFAFSGGVTPAERLRASSPEVIVFNSMRELPRLLLVASPDEALSAERDQAG